MAKMHDKHVYRCVVGWPVMPVLVGGAVTATKDCAALRHVSTWIRLWNIEQPDEHAFCVSIIPFTGESHKNLLDRSSMARIAYMDSYSMSCPKWSTSRRLPQIYEDEVTGMVVYYLIAWQRLAIDDDDCLDQCLPRRAPRPLPFRCLLRLCSSSHMLGGGYRLVLS
jgi:hypothetical protein